MKRIQVSKLNKKKKTACMCIYARFVSKDRVCSWLYINKYIYFLLIAINLSILLILTLANEALVTPNIKEKNLINLCLFIINIICRFKKNCMYIYIY